jgi:tight adherence protein C
MTIVLPLLAFLCVTLLVTAAGLMLVPGTAASVERRLSEIRSARDAAWTRPALASFGRRARALLEQLGRAAPTPAAEASRLRQRLVWAGYRDREAFAVFAGLRAAIAVGCFALLATPVLVRPNLGLALVAGALGWLVPGVALARRAARRQHRIRRALPDALDLLVVSVEAGLGLDQAIQRVSEELALVHPALADELRLITLEMRAGTARADALHNLAARTGVDDVASLVAMLVQTDKFGTSVAQSLRIHSGTLRTKRRQRAEEAAAKTGAKMVFPLVLCIFPAVWVVTIGPAAIKFIQILFPMAEQ